MNTENTILTKAITYFQEQGLPFLGKLALGTAIFILLFFIIKTIIKKVKNHMEANTLTSDEYNQRNSKLVGNVLFTVLMVFNILAVFQIIGFDTAIIMGGLSLSIGFAMETTIGNLIAGVMILTNKKIKLGDFVQFLGSLNIRGTIEEINIRYTIIKLFDKRKLIVPNSIIAKTPIKTLKSEDLIRGEITITVPRHSEINQIKELLIGTINNNKNVLYKEYTSFLITGFDTRGITITGYFFANPKKKTPFIVAREIRNELNILFKKYGIKIPYPHTTLTTE